MKARALTPEPRIIADRAVRLFPFAIAASAALVIGVVMLQRWTQPFYSEHGVAIVGAAGIALVAALALGSGGRRLERAVLPAGLDSRGFTSYVLAIECGLLLVPAAVWLAVWRTRYEEIGGWTYPIVNKRWLVALYYLAIATFVVFPSAIDRWLGGWGDQQPPRESTLPPEAPRSRNRVVLGQVAGIVAALAIGWYFAGPPWHMDRHHRSIDHHEQFHLGSLQAIDKGYVPYVGPASTPYGPGAQFLTYSWMKLRGFTVVSFRESELVFQLITFVAVGVLAHWVAGVWGMVLIVLIGAAYSPLALFHPTLDGTMDGFFGWGNGLRYLGALLVVPALAAMVTAPRVRRAPSWPAVGLGIVWAFFAWVSQENFGTTFIAASLVLTLLWLTDTAPLSTIVPTVLSVLVGFTAAFALVLVYYMSHGAALEFLRNYFFVAGAVAMGFQNTWWAANDSPGHLGAYYFTAPLLITIAVMTLCDVPRVSLRRRLDASQVRLLAFACVLMACYQTALYRSDSSHLMNSMLALPFVLVLAARNVPRWAAQTWPAQVALRGVFVAVAIWTYPIGGPLLDTVWLLRMPLARFTASPPGSDAPEDSRAPFRRATRHLSDEPHAAPGMVPMRPFLEAASGLHDLIGPRRTYVDGVIAGGYTGLYYFMLDLTPGPILVDRESMVINSVVSAEALDHFRRHAGEFDAVLTETPQSPESLAFRAAHPGSTIVTRAIGQTPVYVILNEPE